MIPAVSILTALASAVGVYIYFFEGPQDLIEQTTVTLLGGQRDYRVFILLSLPLAIGLSSYVFLLHWFGKPLSIPFL
jgi:hypothetical protein